MQTLMFPCHDLRRTNMDLMLSGLAAHHGVTHQRRQSVIAEVREQNCGCPNRRSEEVTDRFRPQAARVRLQTRRSRLTSSSLSASPLPDHPSSTACSDSSSATGAAAAFLDFDATTVAAGGSAIALRAAAACALVSACSAWRAPNSMRGRQVAAKALFASEARAEAI